jgi:hypothetical protein
MTDNRKPAPRYRFNSKGDVVFDDRPDWSKHSSPGRMRFRAARLDRRAELREIARLNSPAAIAALIAAASVKA